MYESEFDVMTQLGKVMHDAKNLKDSLERFITFKNPRYFSTRQKLISSCKFLEESIKDFRESYEDL